MTAMKFSEQVELFINVLENDEVKLVEGVSISLVREKWLPIIREFEGDSCSICGTQPALLVDAKEKATYWMCADCMFETITEKRALRESIRFYVEMHTRTWSPEEERDEDDATEAAWQGLRAHLQEEIGSEQRR